MFKKITLKYNLKEILPYIFILLMGLIVFLKPFGNGDELWNYNFARNILQGNIPYKDFSIVQTPLSCYITAAFMFVSGDGLFTFRIAAYVLFISIAFLIFHLSKSTTRNIKVAFLAMLFVMSVHFLPFIYNYNYLTALVLLVIFELEHKEKSSFKLNLLIGLLAGITILIKQNTGVIICFANVIICLRLCIKKPESKIVYAVRVLCSFLPFLLYVMYLWLNGALVDFIEYAVIGIKTFTHRFTIIDFCMESGFYILYLLVIILIYLMAGKKLLKGNVSEYQFAVFAFSLAWISVIFPLADASHVMLVLFTAVPVFTAFYSFEKLRKKEIIGKLIVCVSMMFFYVSLSLPVEAGFNISTLDNYQGVIIDKELETVIQTVDEYINEKERDGYSIRIADASAAAYKIPLNEYEKNWDMMLIGNIGLNTVSDLLETEQPTLYLVSTDEEKRGMQEHFELIDYIKNNYKCIDQIAGFDVYANK